MIGMSSLRTLGTAVRKSEFNPLAPFKVFGAGAVGKEDPFRKLKKRREAAKVAGSKGPKTR